MPARIKVDRDEFLRLSADGWTIPELAEHFDVHPATIGRLRKAFEIKADKRRMMTPERRQVIEGMLADGWSRAEITRTEGADPQTIERHFPGSAWTEKQRAAHLSTLRIQNPYFNKHPGRRLAA